MPGKGGAQTMLLRRSSKRWRMGARRHLGAGEPVPLSARLRRALPLIAIT